MEPSEQGSNGARRKDGEPLDNVALPASAITARVFANYVFVPGRGLPDEFARPSGLHGAGLLVLGDKPAEQILLRTGYATHIGRQSLVPPPVSAEDVVDEIVSGHSKEEHPVRTNQKEVETMTTEIACSACHAVFHAGATTCPNCGIQLTAQAIPVVYREEPRFTLWAVLLSAAVLLIVAVSVGNKMLNQSTTDTRAALLAQLNSGKLATPASFEARCGQPKWTNTTDRGTELHYRLGAADYYVTLSAGVPVFELEHLSIENGEPKVWRSDIEPSEAIELLGCK